MTLDAFRSLRIRLAGLILVTMLLVTGLLTVSYLQERAAILAHMGEDITRLVTLIAEEHEQVITHTRQFLMTLSRAPEIEHFQPTRCADLLDRLLDESSHYRNLGVLDAGGNLLCRAGQGPLEADFAHEPWFLHAVRSHGFALGAVEWGTGGTSGLAVSYAFTGDQNQIGGILFATVDLARLEGLVTRLQPLRPLTFMMFSRSGTLLTCLPSGEHCGASRRTIEALVQETTHKGSGTLELHATDQQEPVLCAFTPLSPTVETGLFLAMSVPVSSLYARAGRVLAYQFAGVWILAALSLTLVWAGSSALIIAPLNVMARTARRLSEGDLSARTGLSHQRGELGFLARALDEMAEALETHHRQVQEYERGLRSMASRLTRAEERERRRIAEGLHDRIGQLLGLSKIKLGILLQSGLRHDAAELGEEIRDLVAQALQETRSLTFEISPPLLYEIGLEAALEYLAERFRERHGLNVVYSDDGLPKALDEDTRVLLYRAAHELLTNVLKHANAKSVRLETESRLDRVILRVEDDGEGFEPEVAAAPGKARDGYGLFSLRERIHHAGGSFTLDSSPGKGCRVVLSLPVNEQSQSSA